MKNNAIITIMILFLLIAAILAAALITTQTILGYTGFSIFNSKSNLILLQIGCVNPYFQSKYGENLLTSLKIGFICTIVTTFFSIFSLILVLTFLYYSKNQNQRQRDETGIQENPQHQHSQNVYIQLQYPSIIQMNSLFISISFAILASFVIFKQYLQYLIEKNNKICALSLSNPQILTITILSGTIMLSSLIALIILAIMSNSIYQQSQKRNSINRSESFRHQLQRIMRQSPQSERKLNIINPDHRELLQNRKEKLNEVNINERESEQKQELDLQKMQKVQSIIYKAHPSLMLQSLVNQK